MKATASATVVIVEDDSSIRRAMERMLRLSGLAAVFFSSGEELLEARLPDSARVLIIDVQLPGMNGFALRERLRDNGWLPPVIFMTAFDDEPTRERARNAGACGFLSKPFTGDALLAAIAATAERRARRA
jgi:FixJ family two-component response regulator